MARLFENSRVFRARQLARLGEYTEAEGLVEKLIQEIPNDVGYNVLLADIWLFSGEQETALAQYVASRNMLTEKKVISDENRRFLAAYINFRTTAIGFEKTKQEFPGWKDLARQINALNAYQNLKTLFRLPE